MNNNTVYQRVGNVVAQWEEDSPLVWTMRETSGEGQSLRVSEVTLNLRPLEFGYELPFLLALKDALIEQRHQVVLSTIATDCQSLRLLLSRVQANGLDAKVAVIDNGFIVALNAMRDEIPAPYLRAVKRLHARHRDDNRLFNAGLQAADFPAPGSKRGAKGDAIHNILAKALRRSTMVHILDVVEAAFEEDRIDIGLYAFIRLAFHIFCRPESYRQLTLADLRVDKHPKSGAVSYFLDVLPAKSGVHNPRKIVYHLHSEVGRLLAMQRESVAKTYGHLVSEAEIGRLALFPARRLRRDGTWVSNMANAHGGMLDSGAFLRTYLEAIRSLTQHKLTFIGLRHTIGTQLAQMGCSATTIQAVLKHTSDKSCQSYVDIVFEGLIDELSDGLQPRFEEHFPAFTVFASKDDPIPAERRIDSEDLETGKIETTAMCGRQAACSYAPITCYACGRFIPCYDADHSINLNVVNREIQGAECKGLAMRHEVKRWKSIRNFVRLVISACESKRMAMEQEAAEGPQ